MSDTRESATTRPVNVKLGRPYRYLTDSMTSPDAAWQKRIEGRAPRAVAYVRVSTEDQAKGLSLEDQQERIAREVARRGWELAGVECDKASGKSTRRPALQRAIAGLDSREYDALVFVRLDRLSRSIRDFCNVVDHAEHKGWAVLSLEPEIDMTSPFHRAVAQLMVVFAEYEREMIGQRQRDSIAARKRAGTYRPPAPEVDAAAVERIGHLVGEGFGARRIRQQLELEGFEPPRGAVWHLSTVQRAMRRLAA